MRYRKEVFTKVGTVACAIGIGFVMQSSPAAETIYGADGPARSARLSNADAAVLDVEEIILTSGELGAVFAPPAPEADVTLAAASPARPGTPQNTAQSELPRIDTAAAEPLDAACDITATARPIAAAMVELHLDAACMAGQRVTVMHSGLLFNELTDGAGQIDVTIPALVRDATFVFAFSNGEGAVVQATVEEVESFARVAVQWKGITGFELHARENGADYGTEGHVWSGAAREISRAVTGKGGYLSRLGNEDVADGLVAEVYTFPGDVSRFDGTVALSVEAQVAQFNCGMEIEAETLHTVGPAEVLSRDLALSVPDCAAEGNFLVLNNLFEDLKVASN